jgi:hypothetical protein
MPIFYTNTGSLNRLEVSGSGLVSGSLSVQGSGSAIFSVSGSAGSLLSMSDLTAGANVFQLTSASIDIVRIDQSKNVQISGSLIITGSIIGGQSPLLYNPSPGAIGVAGSVGQASLFMVPFTAPQLVYDRMLVPFNYSNATNSSNSFTVSFWAGIYTKNVSTLSLLASNSTSYNITNSGTAGSYSLYAGMRNLSMGFTNTLTAGQYYVGMVSRTSTSGGAGMTMSNILASQINSSYSGLFGAASNATNQFSLGLGIYSATTSGIPSTIGFNQLTGNSTDALRPPIFMFANGTV